MSAGSIWLDAFGWFSSALVIYSLMQSRVLRFRVLNLTACALLAVYNAVLSVWPMVAMNAVLCGINLYFIRKLLAERHSPAAYEVLEVPPGDPFLSRFLRIHAEDIAQFFPLMDGGAPAASTRRAFLVLHGDRTAGAVILEDAGGGVADIALDYVTEPFRDFTPGEFVFRSSGVLTTAGFRRIRIEDDSPNSYYEGIGFRRDSGAYVLDL
jgi:hypothetical protein